MQSRRTLLVVLLIGIAVFSALIGLFIGRSGGERGRAMVEQTVSGSEVRFRGRGRTIRFYEGPRIAASFAYWLEGNSAGDRFLVSADNNRSHVVFSVYYTRNGANVHRGFTRSSQIMYHLEHGTAYAGPNDKGAGAWNTCGGGRDATNICVGKSDVGTRLYHIERGRVYAGPRVTTDTLLTADDENLEDDGVLSLLVPILEQRLWEQW